jgi:disulfide bond formation protein DsbB
MSKQNSSTFYHLFLCWLLASIATAGSLFFSEVLEYPPCSLCWYQRIAMYPLVLIFLVGTFVDLKDSVRATFSFSFPLVVIGWLIALYHNLLQYEIIPESASPCREGIPCSINYIEWFGFITIPLLSLIAFSLIGTLLVSLYRKQQKEKIYE